jgi:hypothetical protein
MIYQGNNDLGSRILRNLSANHVHVVGCLYLDRGICRLLLLPDSSCRPQDGWEQCFKWRGARVKVDAGCHRSLVFRIKYWRDEPESAQHRRITSPSKACVRARLPNSLVSQTIIGESKFQGLSTSRPWIGLETMLKLPVFLLGSLEDLELHSILDLWSLALHVQNFTLTHLYILFTFLIRLIYFSTSLQLSYKYCSKF